MAAVSFEKISSSRIDVKDNFSLIDIRNKTPYKLSDREVIDDLKKCFVVCDSTPEVFMFKDYDVITEKPKVSYTNESIAKSKLKKLIVGKREVNNKLITVSACNAIT